MSIDFTDMFQIHFSVDATAPLIALTINGTTHIAWRTMTWINGANLCTFLLMHSTHCRWSNCVPTIYVWHFNRMCDNMMTRLYTNRWEQQILCTKHGFSVMQMRGRMVASASNESSTCETLLHRHFIFISMKFISILAFALDINNLT